MSCASAWRADRSGPEPVRGGRVRPVLALALLGVVLPAHASKPRLRLESVEALGCGREPFLEARVAELELEGQLRHRPPSEYRLVLDDKTLDARPAHVGTFAKSGRRLRVALVIQSSASYATSLDRLRSGLRELLRGLSRETTLSVISYDSEARRLLSTGSSRQAVLALDSLEASGSSAELALDEGLNLGLRSLGPPDRGLRRLLVLISDGVNRSPKRDVFRALGSRARSLQIPIHPVGYSPTDDRGPLINLGELAKRSLGTMRWAPRTEDLPVQLANLGQEVLDQLVLRFPWSGGCRPVSRLAVTSGDLLSNALELRVSSAASRDASALSRSSPLRLGLFLAGLAVAATLLVLTARVLFRPRRGSAPERPPLSEPPPPSTETRGPRPRRPR